MEKNRTWHSLTFEERQLIEKYLKEGKTYVDISILIGRSVNSVATEVRRTGDFPYNAEKAQQKAIERKKEQYEKIRTKIKGTNYLSTLTKRVNNLEMQIEIILDTLKKLMKK